MRDAIGGSMLFYIVIVIITAVMLLFISMLSYSKAYRIKNRIIEIIEKYGKYELDSGSINNEVTEEINIDLSAAGYKTDYPNRCAEIRNRLINNNNGRYAATKLGLNNLNIPDNLGGYNYCVFKLENVNDGYSYVVVTFIEFQVPVLGNFLNFPVYGETKTLGRTYEYEEIN